MTDARTPALDALERLGVPYDITRHGPVRSLAEAAAARGIAPSDLIKTIVVRRTEDDYLFVLLPGDREISWPKLRALLGVNRISMPDAATALAVTGYERGTITAIGSSTDWPVYADASITGRRIAMGAGAHGYSLFVDADDLIAAYGATVADISQPATPR